MKKDYQDIKGVEYVKRGLEVSASGKHNLLMLGTKGSPTQDMAERYTTILPEGDKKAFYTGLSTISYAGMIGGGSEPSKGVVSKVHDGILFLKDLPEFRRDILEVIANVTEAKKLVITRVSTSITHPADFILLASSLPCPCGNFTNPKKDCHCTPFQIQRHLRKLEGRIMNVFGIHIEVPCVNQDQFSERRKGEPSSAIRARVHTAQTKQLKRQGIFNVDLTSNQMEVHCVLTKEAEELLKTAILELGISARAYDKILKLSRTIADMDGSEQIESHHLSEAVGYRCLDRNLWV